MNMCDVEKCKVWEVSNDLMQDVKNVMYEVKCI